MSVLLSSSFKIGDNQYATGSFCSQAKIVELLWNHEGFIGLRIEVGEDLDGNWRKETSSNSYYVRITGSDYEETVTLNGSDELSTYGNVKKLAYEWLAEHTIFTGSII